MKRAIKMSLMGLLTMGLLVSCNLKKEDEKHFVPLEPELQEDYMEMAFGMNLEMVYVQGGSFLMGATEEQEDNARDNEKPVRRINLDGYHIGKYEVSQAQWKAVMRRNISEFSGDNFPVVSVNWKEVQEFCKRLSKQTGKKYVLPTEAQWEYAARGGNKSQHYEYAGISDFYEDVAWYSGNSNDKMHPVGKKKANELGLYDMSGNVWELCSDWYGKYDENDTENPQGPANGSRRVVRGGGYYDNAEACRVSFRISSNPDDRYGNLGFRVACISE